MESIHPPVKQGSLKSLLGAYASHCLSELAGASLVTIDKHVGGRRCLGSGQQRRRRGVGEQRALGINWQRWGDSGKLENKPIANLLKNEVFE